MNDYSDPDRNWETVVGSGERCLPGDESNCGDGGLARDAKLTYPKGTVTDNAIFFGDNFTVGASDEFCMTACCININLLSFEY